MSARAQTKKKGVRPPRVVQVDQVDQQADGCSRAGTRKRDYDLGQGEGSPPQPAQLR